MKPEKLIGIMLITLVLSCEMEEQIDQKTGDVSFETNQQIMNSAFEIEVYIDGDRAGSINSGADNLYSPDSFSEKLEKQLIVGVHNYEVKVHSYNGQAAKSIKGKIIVQENKKSKVLIDFRDFNSWI